MQLFCLKPTAKLPEAFSKIDSESLIRQTLLKNPAIQEDSAIVDDLLEHGEMVFYQRGDRIIEEGAQDNDVYFLVSGEVDIVFKSQLGSKREAPNQIGEMAAIHAGKKRSASVFVRSDEVAALKVPGTVFHQIWSKKSRFQKNLQLEMMTRYRERTAAGHIAKQNNSAQWFATSLGAGLVAGPIAWVFFIPDEWTKDAQASATAGTGLLVFLFMLFYNPAFFWRRCFGLVTCAMVATLALDHFVSIEAKQGFSSLQVSISPRDGSVDWKSVTAFISVMIICACMDFLTEKS